MTLIGGRYQKQVLIGKGGMGTVYRGLDTRTNTTVAIKSPLPAMIDLDMMDRFEREADALRRLDHPNIVRVMDTVKEGDGFHIIMEYVDGGDLSHLIEEGRLTLTRVIQIGLDIADALTRTHRLEIVHRDLKPPNVLLTSDGQVKLTDFGIAHFGSIHDENITDAEQILGTINYMAPEVINSMPVDSRADIWGFGLLLFEMLIGHVPFASTDPIQAIQKILYDPLPDIENLNPDIPTELTDLISRMLHKDRNSRVQLVRRVGYELEMYLGHFMETNPLDSMINHEKMPPTGTQRVSMPDVDTVVDINPISTHVGRPPGHLPIVAEAFIGREAEIAALIERLEQPGIRLVTILAPGGMGKSRLAIEVGARMINHDTSGANFERVVYANMEAVQDAAGIVDALATAIGYSFTADVDLAPNDTTGRLQRLINYVQHQRLLMVIDRFEHLLEHARLIGQLHNNAPDLHILVTSRERLKVAGEDIFPLEGMRTDAHSLDQNTAAQLFVHSAQRITPSFTLEPEDFNNVQRICRLLDGTPLGIVLAATWVEYLSVSDIADELASDINMLSTDRVDIPERQRSLTAVLESSWQRLTPELQKKVIPFFVFRGDFTREAAQEMSGANLMDLRRLVDRAILVRDPLDGHFTVHEIIRQYAERLAREQELYDSLRQKHARYYLRMLHQGEDNLLGQAQRHMIRRIENDIENVEAAWLAAVEYEQVVLLHGALDALHWFAVFRGQWQTVTGLLEKAHQTAARHPGDPHWQLLAARILPRVLDVRAIDMGDLQAAMQTVWEQGDTRAQVGTLLAAGRILKERATLAEARSTFEQVLTMVEEPEDAFYKALALSEFAMCQLDSGETERGIESMNRAMTIQQKSGDEIGQARSLRRLGYLYWMQGNYPEARKRMSQALSYERVIGSPQMVAQSLAALANVTLLEADFDAVTTLTTEAIETARAYKHRRAHGWALIVQGNMANAHNEIDRAIELFKQGLQLVGPNVDLVYDAYWGLSVAHCTSGDFAMAKEHNQNDLAYAVRVKSPAYMALYLPVTAAILAAEGDHDSAIDVLGSALNHVAAPLALLQHLSFVEEVKVQLADVFGDDFDARWQAAASLSLEAVSERYAGPLE